MATKNLKSVLLSLRMEGGTIAGIAKGDFTVEDIASGSTLIDLDADTSLTDAKTAVIANLGEDGSTVVDQTGE